MTVYTIGHSNVSIDAFLALLRHHQISVLVDARSRPYSGYNPHFSREPLKRALEDSGINYLFLGDRIGGKPTSKDFYHEDGRIDYQKLAASDLYLEGIEQVIDLCQSHKVCLMCAEADFRKCHRYWLITRTLVSRNFRVDHILQTGEIIISDQSDFDSQQLELFS